MKEINIDEIKDKLYENQELDIEWGISSSNGVFDGEQSTTNYEFELIKGYKKAFEDIILDNTIIERLNASSGYLKELFTQTVPNLSLVMDKTFCENFKKEIVNNSDLENSLLLMNYQVKFNLNLDYVEEIEKQKENTISEVLSSSNSRNIINLLKFSPILEEKLTDKHLSKEVLKYMYLNEMRLDNFPIERLNNADFLEMTREDPTLIYFRKDFPKFDNSLINEIIKERPENIQYVPAKALSLSSMKLAIDLLENHDIRGVLYQLYDENDRDDGLRNLDHIPNSLKTFICQYAVKLNGDNYNHLPDEFKENVIAPKKSQPKKSLKKDDYQIGD